MEIDPKGALISTLGFKGSLTLFFIFGFFLVLISSYPMIKAQSFAFLGAQSCDKEEIKKKFKVMVYQESFH